MVISINGVDVTSFVAQESFRIDNILTQQVDRCSFKIRSFGDQVYIPKPGRQVIITDAGVTVFGGVITRVSIKVLVNNIQEYTCECMDYTRLLDQHLVADVYEDMTVNEIIASMIATFCPPGVTGTQVDCTLVINYIQFQYEPVSACLKQLADIAGCDWYIDYAKDIYFKTPSATSAPIEITDDSGVYATDTLIVRRDNSQLRNSIIVRGGQYLGAQFTFSAHADGENVSFLLPYKFQDLKVRVGGVTQNLGIDSLDDAASFDALYNFNEKLVKWREGNKPIQDATLSISGKPYLPVIIKLKNPVSASAIYSAEGIGDGSYEYLVIDKSINSKEGARERARAEINTYGRTLSEGEFITESLGLRAGQQIHVASVALGIDEYFIINRVVSIVKDDNSLKYQVSLITTRTMDWISVMKKLLLDGTKKIEIKQDEVLDLIEAPLETIEIQESMTIASRNEQAETITITEVFTNNGINFAIQFVYGPFAPTATQRVFILNGSTLG